MNNIIVTVCSPVHNEEENLAELISRMTEAMETDYSGRWEYLLVDDCSTDNSLQLLEEAAGKNPALKVLSHDRNRGERAAWLTGFRAARGEVVATLAADLQSQPEAVPKLIDVILKNGFDVGTAQRKNRQDKKFYLVASFFLTIYARVIFNTKVKDVSSSFFAARSFLLKDLKLIGNDHRYIIPILKRRGAKISEIPIPHMARTKGKSHYTYLKVLKAIPELAYFTFRYFNKYYDLSNSTNNREL